MKLCHHLSKNNLVSLFAVVLGFLSVGAAHAQILLTVDELTPNKVVVSATGNFPSASVSPYLIADGIDLVGLFNTPVGFDTFTVSSTSLTTGDGSSGPVFTEAAGDDYSLSNVDLNLFHNHSSDTISFTTGQAAFQFSLTLNLSTSLLMKVGSTGEIVTGFSNSDLDGSPNTPIGSWEIIATPEPSTWTLMLGCLGLLVLWRRRHALK